MTIYQGSDQIAHHAANAAAIAFPIASIMLQLPTALSIVLMILGIGWYIVLFTEKVAFWRAKSQTVKTITVTKTIETAPPSSTVPPPAAPPVP